MDWASLEINYPGLLNTLCNSLKNTFCSLSNVFTLRCSLASVLFMNVLLTHNYSQMITQERFIHKCLIKVEDVLQIVCV
jgi:hypothetical protein